MKIFTDTETFSNTIKRILTENREIRGETGISEIKRHASVSTNNNHKCDTCFTCACARFIKKSIYKQAVLLGEDIDYHESDLYIKVSPVSRELVNGYKHKDQVKTFISQIDNAAWFEVPFEFKPFWDKKN